MCAEKNLLENYPKTARNVDGRAQQKTAKDREVARRFGEEFFDGERRYGYGGYSYDEKYWSPVMPTFFNEYKLGPGDEILDVGCAKGFMLVDFIKHEPGLSVRGIDVSEYAISNAHSDVEKFLEVGDARELPFEDNTFDLVVSINTIHNLEIEDCKSALKEIERVSRQNSFITVDAYRNEEEKCRMEWWNLTALTILQREAWVETFRSVGYTGDYYWFTP